MQIDDELLKLLNAHFWANMQNIYTAIPCIVVDVHDDLEEMRVAVQPSIDILGQDGKSQQRPVMANIPVIMPSSSTSAFTFPINKGDPVMCLFSMRGMEVFSESFDARPQPPNNFSKFRQKDAVAIPCVFPKRMSINKPSKRTHAHSTKDVVIVHNIGKASEVELRMKPNGDFIINSPTKVIVNTEEAEVNASSSASITTPELNIDADTTNWVGNITLNGNIAQTGSQSVSGDVVASGKSLATHTHSVPNISSGSDTATSLPPS